MFPSKRFDNPPMDIPKLLLKTLVYTVLGSHKLFMAFLYIDLVYQFKGTFHAVMLKNCPNGKFPALLIILMVLWLGKIALI